MSKPRSNKSTISGSRRSSQEEYDWDEHFLQDKGKKSSKVPTQEKLIKRRDQNRVSQRAFRQRKERHTQELEAKVEELRTLLENASAENSIVTSQMNRMEEELRYYRRLLFSGVSGSAVAYSPSPSDSASYPANNTQNFNSNTSYYSPAPSNVTPVTTSYSVKPASATSDIVSSAMSSPPSSTVAGDLDAAVGTSSSENFWGYDVFRTVPPYPSAYTNYDNPSGNSNQGRW